ncbi:MAG: hypothetical protein CMK71_00500 [Pseudomonadaceae bacterium]|nr:hypothetical protein [Pseudomonadaceae bacterium]
MDVRDKQLAQLMSLYSRTLTHLTAALADMSFELMRSSDEVAKQAGQRMINHVTQIGAGLDQQWPLIAAITGESVEDEPEPPVTEVQLLGVGESQT